MERVGWIDFLKGIAMILILVFHTEVYYKQHDVTPYYIYTTNTIVLFYFISGYLFFRNGLFQWRKRITSIVRSLLIPYFIFTTLIAIPKLLIRQMDVNWTEIAINIITGWDLDLTIGSHTLEQYHTEFTSPEYPLLDPFRLITRLKQLNHNHFNQKVIERYKELRNTFFNYQNLFSRYESYYNILKLSGAAEREEKKWSGNSDIYGNEINFR